MAWDDAPPTTQELSSSSWDSTPPTAEELKGPQWSDLRKNIGPDASNVLQGNLATAERIGKGVMDLPTDALESGIGALSGQKLADTPLAKDVETTATGVGNAVGNIIPSIANLGSKSEWVEHPVQNAITAGGLLEGGASGLLREPNPGLIGKMGEAVENAGGREVTQVAGIQPRTIEKLTPKGGNEARTRADLGKQLVDEKVVGGIGSTPEAIRDKFLDQKEAYGDQVKDLIGKVKNSGVEPTTQASVVLKPILDEWAKLADSSQPEDHALARRYASTYTKLEEIANKNNGRVGYDDIHNEMNQIGSLTNRMPKDNPKLGELNRLYGTLAGSRDSIVNDVSQRSGNPALAKQLQDANRGFHQYSTMERDVRRLASKEGMEPPSKLGMYGALWAMAHGAFDKAAEFFVGGRLLGPALKEVTPSVATHGIKMGQMIQKYGPLLRNAAGKGARNLALTSYLISQKDPDFAGDLSAIGQTRPERNGGQ